MVSVEEKLNYGGGLVSGGHSHTLIEGMQLLKEMQDHNSGVRKQINSELWHACAGPLVTLPQVGSLVYYFPQGHSEQVAVSINRATTAQIPNYPNLPPQLLCQVHNVTLHADKDTDEIYAQMSLQPVNSDKDVIPTPNFGLKPSKHPVEFFCKTLTASDTSTHGGFSVPRRAAEKLFPQLDYSMQPPNQELLVRDLHDNTWTFRHIYRGQPKRHLLTTGWSMFVGAKRLRAGDAVLFIRDEKSQLMLGVRRANRQQTALPSSVLSADSMHIGILAAAAHAAASRSPFTIFYNPRACPSEFVIPFVKYRKAIYGTQLSIGLRFGMMFETEESSKRRYMGTIMGIGDLDPLRWPNSKWRSIQVEWDEPGCGDKQNRVSPWEIETPESLFIFPSLTANLKHPFHSSFFGATTELESFMNRSFLRVPENIPIDLQGPSLPSRWSDQVMKMLVKPISPRSCSIVASLQESKDRSQEAKSLMQQGVKEKPEPALGNSPALATDQSSQLEAQNRQNLISNPAVMELHDRNLPLQSQQMDPSPAELAVTNTSVQFPRQVENTSYAPPMLIQSGSLTNPYPLPVIKNPPTHPCTSSEPPVSQELWDPCFGNATKCVSPPMLLPHQDDMPDFHYSLSCGLKDENNNADDIYSSCFNLDGSNSGSMVVDPSVSSIVLDDFCTLKNVDFQNPSDYTMGSFCSNQDVQSQITYATLADSQNFSLQEYADNSGGVAASSSNMDFDHDNNLFQHGSWQQVTPRFRTYTKIQKAGSVGRSIDVASFKTYDELRGEIERMFGLDGLLNDLNSGWKLVYVDFENDVLLVGDDPWPEFVGCVRCIRILSPPEVQQIGEEGMQLLNSVGVQGIN